MNTFLFFRYRNRMLNFFSYLVKEDKYWEQITNRANIVSLSPNQTADVTDSIQLQLRKLIFWKIKKKLSTLLLRLWIKKANSKFQISQKQIPRVKSETVKNQKWNRKVYNQQPWPCQQRNYCVALIRKIKQTLFGATNTTDVTDNKTFWRTVKLFFTDNVTTRSKITLIEKKGSIKKR